MNKTVAKSAKNSGKMGGKVSGRPNYWIEQEKLCQNFSTNQSQ